MGRPGFATLVGGLVEAMGLNVAAVRPRDELVLVRTPDGFLFAFVDDTSLLSLEHVRQLFVDVADAPSKVVVLTPDRLPLALGTAVSQKGGTLVEGTRFTELAKGLGVGDQLGEPPRAQIEGRKTRLLPSARLLDSVLDRARTWEEWGVPALALRFYRQASDLKPEFAPAKLGIGRALLALGLPMEADRTFADVLRSSPENVDARIGHAAVLGATGHPAKEIDEYRALLAANESRADLRAHLLAALLEARAWSEARDEVEAMLRPNPDDPRLRFLHSVTLDRLGRTIEASGERDRARALGLPYESERALCEHLGLPIPTPYDTPGPARPTKKTRPPPKARRSTATTAREAPSKKPIRPRTPTRPKSRRNR